MSSALLNLNALAADIHEWAVSKGFYDHEKVPGKDMPGADKWNNPSLSGEKIALMHSELSEMLSALRDADDEHEREEMADLFIRALDYCGWKGWDIEKAIVDKLRVNADRPYLHGRKF